MSNLKLPEALTLNILRFSHKMRTFVMSFIQRLLFDVASLLRQETFKDICLVMRLTVCGNRMFCIIHIHFCQVLVHAIATHII